MSSTTRPLVNHQIMYEEILNYIFNLCLHRNTSPCQLYRDCCDILYKKKRERYFKTPIEVNKEPFRVKTVGKRALVRRQCDGSEMQREREREREK